MNSRDFCYWLQGLFELNDPDTLSPEQVKMIKDHLQLVFKKETPSYVDVRESDPNITVTCDNSVPINHELEGYIHPSSFFNSSNHPASC